MAAYGHHLKEAGAAGLSFDEVLAKVGPDVPAGYAWRAYVSSRRSWAAIRKGTRAESPARVPTIVDTPAHRVAAIRFIVRKSLGDMVRLHTAIRRTDGRYAEGVRKPKSVFTDEQEDVSKERTRKLITTMELIRKVDELEQQLKHAKRENYMPKDFLSAVRRWRAAHAVQASS